MREREEEREREREREIETRMTASVLKHIKVQKNAVY